MEPLHSYADEVQDAMKAYKNIGGRIEKRYRWSVDGGRRHLVAFARRMFEKWMETEECIVTGLEEPIWFFVMRPSTEDEDLKNLPVVPFSFGLDLWDALITDAGLGHLARLTTLSALCLHWSNVTGTGLFELAHLQDLISLDLSKSWVTDKGLAGLAGLHRLSALDLSETKITDAGLRHVGALHSLTWLSLCGSMQNWGMFTDAGLKKLATLTNLSVLDFGLSNITEKGVRGLQAALPNCCVIRTYAGSDWEYTTKSGPA